MADPSAASMGQHARVSGQMPIEGVVFVVVAGCAVAFTLLILWLER